MPTSYRSSSASGSADTLGTSCTVPVPTGAASGDIALLAVEQWEAGNPAVTWPAGFAELISLVSGSQKLKVAWKRLTAADSGNYIPTWTGTQWNMGHCILIPGALATGDPVDASNTATGSGTSYPVAAVTTTGADFLALFVASENAATDTPPAGFTNAQDGNYLATHYRIPGAASTYSSAGGSTSASTLALVALIALKPEAAAAVNAFDSTAFDSGAFDAAAGGSPVQHAAAGTVAASSSTTGATALRAAAAGAVAAATVVGAAATSLLPGAGGVAATSSTTGAAGVIHAASGRAAATSAAAGSAGQRAVATGSTAAVSGTSGAASVIGGPQQYAGAGNVAATSGTTGAAGVRRAASGAVSATSSTTGAALLRAATGGRTSAASGVTGAAGLIAPTGGSVAIQSDAAGAASCLYPAAGAVYVVSMVAGSAEGGAVADVTVLSILEHPRMVAILDHSQPVSTTDHSRVVRAEEIPRAFVIEEGPMRLHPNAREFYELTIATEPEVAGWDASFDGGGTWVAGELVTVADPAPGSLRVRWLVAGPGASPTGASPITRTTKPLLRATESPELVIRPGPTIYV